MATRSARPDVTPLVVIVGETGTGKTALAIELAKHFDGEIICADSRTVYKGMDIGTAKPTDVERRATPHYGLDLVEPGQSFTAFDFQQLACKAIDDIARRGKLPIMVGGTGLYIDAVIYNFTFRPLPLMAEREKYAGMSVGELQQAVRAAGMELPSNSRNPRHLMRMLEGGPPPPQPRLLRPHTLVLGLRVDKDKLRERITERVEAMFAHGLIDEVESLRKRYGQAEAFRAPGYRAVGAYLDRAVDLAAAKRKFIRDDMQLAKRQRTWFRRSQDIHWITQENKLDEAVGLVTTFLSS